MERKKITFDSFIRGSIGCVLVVGILMLVERLSGVLLPFFIAWLIAYMVYPLVKFFQYKLRLKSRIISIFCSLFLITVIGITLFYLLVPPMISEIGRMNDLLVTYLTNGAGNNVPKNLSEFIHENIDLQALNRVLSEENILAAIKDTVPRVWTLLAESLNILFSILASFIILLYVIFILLDYEAIAEGWLHLLPNKYRTFASNLVHDVQDGMNRYFRGQALVAFCVGILFSIGFLIIDFPMAIALGLFIGALNMVPYLQIIGFLPTILLAILKAADTGQNFWIIIACALAVFAIVQIIQDTFLVPKIMGKITGLNPAIILLSLSIWGSLMGMLGMIIALPLTTLMLSYYQRFIINKEKIKYDEGKQTTINRQYSELQSIREGIPYTYLKSIIKDIILTMTDLRRMTRSFKSKIEKGEELSLDHVIDTYASYEDDLLDILEKNGVTAYSYESEVYEPRKQKVIKIIDTDDEKMNKVIAERLMDGFIKTEYMQVEDPETKEKKIVSIENIIEKEHVNVYKYVPSEIEISKEE